MNKLRKERRRFILNNRAEYTNKHSGGAYRPRKDDGSLINKYREQIYLCCSPHHDTGVMIMMLHAIAAIKVGAYQGVEPKWDVCLEF